MSRTDLDATTLANSLRASAGDGSVEWVSEPIQASVLLDIADTLDENAKLREIIADLEELLPESERWYSHETVKAISENNASLRKLVRDMYRDFVNCDCELRLHGRMFMAEARYAHRLRELGVEVDA